MININAIEYILVGLFLVFLILFTFFGAKSIGERLGDYMYRGLKKD